MRSSFAGSVVLVVFSVAPCLGAEVAGFQENAEVFFEESCVDCHDGATKKGGLDLTAVDPEMLRDTDLWTRIHDRVRDGEMPPKKKKRPDAAEVEKLLGWISPKLAEADKKKREVVLRRLNRVEYGNTIRDLMGVDVEVEGILPADQKAGGFDNNGAALALSTDQLQAYMRAAGMAADAVLFPGEKPHPETRAVDMAEEVAKFVAKYPGPDFAVVDGRAASFKTEGSTYSQLATRKERTKRAGKYRFRFEVQALNTEEDLVFSVVETEYSSAGPVDRNIGYFEAGPEVKVFELEVDMPAEAHLQFFPIGLPKWLKERGPEVKHPGIAFGKAEMTGPVAEVWPPASYTALIGEMDTQRATEDDSRRVMAGFLPRAFRREVSSEEIERYAGLVNRQMAEGQGFLQAVRTGVVAVLCSPGFIYLQEDAGERVDDSELAVRLAYFFWSTMPDEELLRLGRENSLNKPDVLRAQVERMLKDPKGEAFVKNFTGQWLHLREINDTTPDEKLYWEFEELLQVSMVREGEGFFREILNADLDIANFIDSDFAMLNARLAKHYGVDGVKGLELKKVKLPEDSVRGGVMTQAGVLKVTANGTNTSPVMRGVWVLENILGKPTPPPPPGINGIEPDIRGAVTVREQLAKHRDDPSCNSCHQYIDPPGFALESFDPTGAFRKNYLRYHVSNAEKGWGHVAPGAPVDASGETSGGGAFTDITGFKALLMERKEDFARCLTGKLLAYGLGREMGFSDRREIDRISKSVAAKGNGLRTLVHEIVKSEIFTNR